MSSIQIGDAVKIDVTVLDDAGYEDMRRFNKKIGVVVGIGDVLPGLVTVEIGKKRALLKPICLSVKN